MSKETHSKHNHQMSQKETCMELCPPPHLIFTEVISRRTAYGLIWIGKYRQHNCVVKMIMLTTGIHYDKDLKEYQTPQKTRICEAFADKYFNHNDAKPFYHTDFRHRRSMTPEAYFKEVDDLINLSRLGIAPKVYGFGINHSYPIHYGFIVMDKVDCSLKDIYLTRDLTDNESTIIKEIIDRLHNKHGFIHGDLKPSNIGVYLDKQGKVINACFFDCQKIKHREQCTPEEFKKLATRESGNFKKHIIKNISEGPSKKYKK